MAEPEQDRTLDEERSQPFPARKSSLPPVTDSAPGPTLPEAGSEPPKQTSAPLDPELPTVPRAVYEAGEEIARGGIGRIYRARDLRLGRIVAIKELLEPTTVNQRRFLREIEVTVGLEHPNIVSIHEAGRWPDGQPFYSMNFVRGSTLLAAIETCHSIEERLELLPAMINVAEAVAYAHDKGVIHRDLKPANVLVGRFGETVVIDWGLAKYEDRPEPEGSQTSGTFGHTRQGAVVGTPPYMPPEQARGETVDKRSDVYALGSMLYQLLSGLLPYHDVKNEDVVEEIRKHAPLRLSALAPELAPDLLAIVDKAMARQASNRYADAGAMAEELRRFAAGRLVGAYSYGITDLLARFVKRHLASVITAAIAAFVLLASASYSVSTIRSERDTAQELARIAQEQRDNAEAQARELIVARARALTDSDPTEAVARLKHLPNATPGAISVGARAEELGVAKAVLTGAASQLSCAVLSPDGKLAAAAGESQDILLWTLDGPGASAPFGENSVRRLIGHRERITDCVFSSDGKQLATTGYDGQIILWDVADSTQRLLPSPDGTIRSLTYSPDRKRLAAVSAGGVVREWSLETNEFRDTSVSGNRRPILEYMPDGKSLLTGPHLGRLLLWTPKSDAEPLVPPTAADGVVAAQALSDSQVLLSTDAGDVQLWTLPAEGAAGTLERLYHFDSAVSHIEITPGKGEPLIVAATMNGDILRLRLETAKSERLTRHGERISSVQVGGDGRYVASAGWDKLVRVVDLETRSQRVLRGHSDVVSTLSFANDGESVLSGSWDHTLRLWPVDDELHRKREVLQAHPVGVHGVRYSPNGKYLVSGGHDDRVRVWNQGNGTHRVFEGHQDHVFRVVFSHDGRQVASSSDDMTVRLWNLDTDFQRVLSGHRADVEEIAFSPNDQWLLSGSEDNTARLWDIASGTSIVMMHQHAVTNVDFSPDGRRFATASRSGKVRIYSLSHPIGPALLPEQEFQHPDEVWAIDFSPRGNWFASADLSGALEARQLDTNRTVSLGPVPRANILRFSNDERWLAVAGRGGQLWLCEPSRALCRILNAGQSVVHTLAFTPDSKMLFTAGGDALLYGWDVETGEHRIYEGHRAPIFDLDVRVDGAQVVTASADETLRIWPVVPLPQPSSFKSFLDQLTRHTVHKEDGPAESPY